MNFSCCFLSFFFITQGLEANRNISECESACLDGTFDLVYMCAAGVIPNAGYKPWKRRWNWGNNISFHCSIHEETQHCWDFCFSARQEPTMGIWSLWEISLIQGKAIFSTLNEQATKPGFSFCVWWLCTPTHWQRCRKLSPKESNLLGLCAWQWQHKLLLKWRNSSSVFQV